MTTSTPSAANGTFLKLPSKPAVPSMISPFGPLALAMAKSAPKVTDITAGEMNIPPAVEGKEQLAKNVCGQGDSKEH